MNELQLPYVRDEALANSLNPLVVEYEHESLRRGSRYINLDLSKMLEVKEEFYMHVDERAGFVYLMP